MPDPTDNKKPKEDKKPKVEKPKEDKKPKDETKPEKPGRDRGGEDEFIDRIGVPDVTSGDDPSVDDDTEFENIDDVFGTDDDDFSIGNYNKNNVFDQGVLDSVEEAAERRLNRNKREWEKTDIDTLRIDSKKALKYRNSDSFKESLAGQWANSNYGQKGQLLKSLQSPIYEQVARQQNPNYDPFNTFFITKEGELSNRLPSKRNRVDNQFTESTKRLAKELGVPANTSTNATIGRIEKLKTRNPSNLTGYKAKGEKELGINIKSKKELRDDIGEPLTIKPSTAKPVQLKTPAARDPRAFPKN